MIKAENNMNRRIVYGVLCALICVLPFMFQALESTFWMRTLCIAMLYVMLAQGLNIVVGMAGLLDLGYIGFYAIGAYLYALTNSGHLATQFEFAAQLQASGWLPLSILIVIPIGACLAAFAGLLFGYPTLKLRGDYLAIVTLGFGEIVHVLIRNLELTKGAQGIAGVRPISSFGLLWEGRADVTPRGYMEFLGVTIHPYLLYFFLFFVIALLLLVVCKNLQNSRLGRSWMALREDEIAAKAMGIDVRNVKLWAFAIGASFAGVAGALFASLEGGISPDSFKLEESVMVVAMVVLGGIGHIRGVLLGAILLYVIPAYLLSISSSLDAFQIAQFGRVIVEAALLKPLMFALALILIMLYRPKGVWPAPAHGNSKVVDTAPGSKKTVGANV
jgi:branched-chain amino acid transport system permease protein